jgi:hypothetical protein
MVSPKIEEVLKQHTGAWMAIPGVIGTGQGLCDGKSCIKIFVIKTTEEINKKIPQEIEGYKVKIEETGKVRAYAAF